MLKCRSYLVLVLACSFLLSCSKQSTPSALRPEVKLHRLEGYPASRITVMTDQQEALSSAGGRSAHLYSIVSMGRTWPAKHPIITVAFQGGSPALRSQIMEALQAWTSAANITFDFGPDAGTGRFREWATGDMVYAADVRIAFMTGEDGGYWSEVGNDSIKSSRVKPGQASMNFEGFPDDLPTNWQATVLHEFGHALGFEHEHQSPNAPCEQEFRWDDDPGYVQSRDSHGQFIQDPKGHRPGIYTVLGGPPNKWNRKQIDFNLRQLPQSADWILSSFDKESIMKYQFDPWMFNHGNQSGCYSDQNLVLSAQDLEAAQETYPRSSKDIAQALDSQMKAGQELMKLKRLPSAMQAEFRANVLAVKKAKLQ